MSFSSDKHTFLEKEDKSVKGSIDGHIKDLCDLINSMDNYYTTSSCSGRIVIIRMPQSGKRREAEWLFVSHDEAGFYNLKNELSVLPEDDVWFRFEPFILHVASETLEGAERLLNLARQLGIKRSGIISTGNKNVVEMIGTERIDTIIAKDGRLLVSDEYLQLLIEKSNRKMHRNWENINKVFEEVKKL
jgi:tRNA wybutosine-synthesizing protein 3